MSTPTRSNFRARLALGLALVSTAILNLAPYAAQALVILGDPLEPAAPPNPETSSKTSVDFTATATDDKTSVEVQMQRYDVHLLEMTRFHTGRRHLPNDADILQHAFNIGIHSAGNAHLRHVSRMLLDNGGPGTNMVMLIRATERQLAQIEVLRHDFTPPGETLCSRDEAVRIAVRRGMDHIKAFGMPNDREEGIGYVPMMVPHPAIA